MSARDCLVRIACADAPGIVQAVSTFLLEQSTTIEESQQFSDTDSGTFFMRVRFRHSEGGELDVSALSEAFAPLAADWGMSWRMVDAARPMRVLIMVSRYAHCLNDLLFRTSLGDLNIQIVTVVSNHPDLARLADDYNVPFRHIPVTAETKPAAEAELMRIVDADDIELVILARYMQILSEGLCQQLEGRAINIHHSMLPSFKGAKPYEQAHQRGVKVIGATSHYVTPDLDEGPIIDQEDARVDHTMSAADFAARGREVECSALARAVRWHAENRIALNGHKTVLLR